MKKFSFKSIAFLMSLIMIFSIVAPVCASAAEWAHDDHKHEKDGPINYVSIGDSMVNGYGLPGYFSDGGVLDYGFESYTNRFAAYLAGMTDEQFDALVGAAIEGNLDFGKVFTGANGTVNHSQLAMSAMRIEDIHWLLEVNLEDPAVVALLNEIGEAKLASRGWDSDLNEKWHSVFETGDAWIYNELLSRRLMNAAHQINHANGVAGQKFDVEVGVETNGQDNEYCECFWYEYGPGAITEAVRVVSDYYKAAVAEADVISLGLGNGNFGVFM
ncbi:MAG: hypothetical protein IKV16_00670, partial [Clostridia bacterium]|nr:hypothetical protein [Clostridia bacterium]